MMIANEGDWVEIQNVISPSEKDTTNTSEDTNKSPLVKWTRGFMITKEAIIGDEVEIETMRGRIARGCLSSINPRETYDCGEPVKQLIQIKMELQKELEKLRHEK